MPHIDLPSEYPGIRSLFIYSPVTAKPLNDLVQTLMHDPGTSTLTPGERELIAAYTSSLNECKYCASTHGAIAKYQLNGNADIVQDILKKDINKAEVSDKLKALLHIAGKVQDSGKSVSSDDISKAKEQGATDREIHDTVLIAAAFCMFNRYVDGLATWTPDDAAVYDAIGEQRAREGYLTKPFVVKNPANKTV
ncbi:MAG TPA: peroxidase-related enzyme [Hanamia sp.]